jgi:D-aminopeptidase
LQVDGVPVGREIPHQQVPEPFASFETVLAGSSIIVVIATDAPLHPLQCRRLAQRATIGVGRVGGLGENSSGDIFIAFSTANRGLDWKDEHAIPITIQVLQDPAMDSLFEAAADATEEAILNAMCMATTMTGVNGRTVYAIPMDWLEEVMRLYRRAESA